MESTQKGYFICPRACYAHKIGTAAAAGHRFMLFNCSEPSAMDATQTEDNLEGGGREVVFVGGGGDGRKALEK